MVQRPAPSEVQEMKIRLVLVAAMATASAVAFAEGNPPPSQQSSGTSQQPVGDPAGNPSGMGPGAYVPGNTIGAAPDFKQLDSDGDEKLTKDELSASPALSAKFRTLDVDGDGKLTKREFAKFETKEKGK